MHDGAKFLLIYGTLLESLKHPYSRLLKNHAHLLGKGKFRGILLDLGDYPGAIYQPDSSSLIFGELYQLIRPQKVIPVLDHYEGTGKDFKKPTDFIRALVPVKAELGDYQAWVYLYNLETASFRIIESGDYADYITIN